MKGYKSIHVFLSDSFYNELKAFAKIENCTISGLFRIAVRWLMDESKNKQNQEEGK